MTRNEIVHARDYAKRVGYLKLNTEKDYLFDKEKILFQMNKNISNYKKYNANFHCFEAAPYFGRGGGLKWPRQ